MSELDNALSQSTTRRQALKRGAAVAGAAVWVTPVVQALRMSPASAARPSGHIDSGRGNGSLPIPDLDPGNSGLVNKGGD